MKAVKLDAQIQPDHTLRLQLPEDVAEGPAEVIVLVPEETRDRPSLSQVLEELDRRTHPRRSRSDIDRQVKEERDSWD